MLRIVRTNPGAQCWMADGRKRRDKSEAGEVFDTDCQRTMSCRKRIINTSFVFVDDRNKSADLP